MVSRLKRVGRIVVTKDRSLTSSRRWREEGVVRTFLAHQRILLGSKLGVPAEKLTGTIQNDMFKEFIAQKEARGYGNALHCAHGFTGKVCFLLVGPIPGTPD